MIFKTYLTVILLIIMTGVVSDQDRCGTAPSIVLNEQVIYPDPVDDLYPDGFPSCSGKSLRGPEVAYRFVPEYTSGYQVYSDGFVEVREGICQGECKGGDYYNNSFFAQAGIPYFIIVEGGNTVNVKLSHVTCASRCGSKGGENCYCDSLCRDYDDCCSNFGEQCLELEEDRLNTYQRVAGSLGLAQPTWRASMGGIDASANGEFVISAGAGAQGHRLWYRENSRYIETTPTMLPDEYGRERKVHNAIFIDMDGDGYDDLLFPTIQESSSPHGYFWRPDLDAFDSESSIDGFIFPNVDLETDNHSPLLRVNDTAVGDWNRDGFPDIFLARGSSRSRPIDNQIYVGLFIDNEPISVDLELNQHGYSTSALFIPNFVMPGFGVFVSADAATDDYNGYLSIYAYGYDGLERRMFDLGDTKAQTIGAIDLNGDNRLDIIVFDGYSTGGEAYRINIRGDSEGYPLSTQLAACQYCSEAADSHVCSYFNDVWWNETECMTGLTDVVPKLQHKIFLNDGGIDLQPLEPFDENGDYVDLWPEVLRDPYRRIDEATPILVNHGIACDEDSDCSGTQCIVGECEPTMMLFLHSDEATMSDEYVQSVHLGVLEPKANGVGLRNCPFMDPGLDRSEPLKKAQPRDLNGDGAEDLLLAFDAQQTVYRGDDTGCFLPESPMPIGETRRNAQSVLRDFDGDGDLDLFSVTGENPGEDHHPFRSLDVLMLNDGEGNFTDYSVLLPDHEEDTVGSTFASRTSRGVVAEDFDQDGDIDIIVTQYYNKICDIDGESFAKSGSFRVYENKIWEIDRFVDSTNGDNGQWFKNIEFVDTMLECKNAIVALIAAGDLNGDSWLDLVAVTRKGTNVVFLNYFEQGGIPLQKYENLNTTIPSLPEAGSNRSEFVVVTDMNVLDVDGNGLDDIIIAANDSGSIEGAAVFLSHLDDNEDLFWNKISLERTIEERLLAGLVVGDVTGDSRPDVILATSAGDDTYPNLDGAFIYKNLCARDNDTAVDWTCAFKKPDLCGEDDHPCICPSDVCPQGSYCDIETGECILDKEHFHSICCTDKTFESCESHACYYEYIEDYEYCRSKCEDITGISGQFFVDALLNKVVFEGVIHLGVPTVHEILIYVNNGSVDNDISFSSPIRLGREALFHGNVPNALALADVNNDGRRDLIFPIYSPGLESNAYRNYTVFDTISAF